MKVSFYFLVIITISSCFFYSYKKVQESAVSEYKIAALKENKAIEQKYKKALEQKERELISERAIYDSTINDSKEYIQRLANDIDKSRKRVLINATCPTVRTDTAEDNASAASEGKAELDKNVRQDFYNLRSGIVELESALQLCLKTWY